MAFRDLFALNRTKTRHAKIIPVRGNGSFLLKTFFRRKRLCLPSSGEKNSNRIGSNVWATSLLTHSTRDLTWWKDRRRLKGRIGQHMKRNRCARAWNMLWQILARRASRVCVCQHSRSTHKKGPFLRSNDHAYTHTHTHMFISLISIGPLERAKKKNKHKCGYILPLEHFLRFHRV